MSDFDPTDTVAIEEREEARKKEAKRIADQEVEDLKWLMSDKRGRRVMWSLLAFTGFLRQPWQGDNGTDFRCGMMNVGQKLFGDIQEHCPARYNEMVTERLK